MENYNNYQNPYYGEEVKPKKTFGKSQTSLFAKSMLIAGAGFILIFGISWLLSWAFSFVKGEAMTNPTIVFSIILGTLLVSMIISMIWTRILWKGKSTGLTILVYSIYIATMSLSFGYLFAYITRTGGAEYQYMLPLCFAVAGTIFLLVTLVAKLIGIRGMITFGKIIAVTGAIAGAAFFAFLITFLVLGPRMGWGSARVVSFISMSMIALVMFFYIIIDIKMIMAASQFNEYTGLEENAPAIVWYFGFKLLSDIINVLFWVVIWITRLIRR